MDESQAIERAKQIITESASARVISKINQHVKDDSGYWQVDPEHPEVVAFTVDVYTKNDQGRTVAVHGEPRVVVYTREGDFEVHDLWI